MWCRSEAERTGDRPVNCTGKKREKKRFWIPVWFGCYWCGWLPKSWWWCNMCGEKSVYVCVCVCVFVWYIWGWYFWAVRLVISIFQPLLYYLELHCPTASASSPLLYRLRMEKLSGGDWYENSGPPPCGDGPVVCPTGGVERLRADFKWSGLCWTACEHFPAAGRVFPQNSTWLIFRSRNPKADQQQDEVTWLTVWPKVSIGFQLYFYKSPSRALKKNVKNVKPAPQAYQRFTTQWEKTTDSCWLQQAELSW